MIFKKSAFFLNSTRYREEKRIEPSDGLQPFAKGRLRAVFSQFGRISRAGRSLRSARTRTSCGPPRAEASARRWLVPSNDVRFPVLAAGGRRHFKRLDARFAIRRRERRRTARTCVRTSGCSLRSARTRTSCGPPLREASAHRRLGRRAMRQFGCKLPYYRDAACEGTRRLRSGPSPGRSCGPPMACAIESCYPAAGCRAAARFPSPHNSSPPAAISR